MSIATEILGLRKDKLSSVERLLAAIEWQNGACELDHLLYRGVAVREAADLVLTNVAAYAAEAEQDLTMPTGTLRTIVSERSRRRSSRRWWSQRAPWRSVLN